MLLFFGSELLLTARFPVALLTLLYVATVAAGYISLLTAGTWISRLLKNQLMDDVFNDENAVSYTHLTLQTNSLV